MDNKLLLIFILLFLSFLLLFYYLKLKTNVIMLLSIIIVLCINKLIVQKEYFTEDDIYYRLITHMLEFTKKKQDNHVASILFEGSKSNSPSTSQSGSTKNNIWEEVLTDMRGNRADPNENSLPHEITFPFIKSIPPNTTNAIIPTTIV